MARRAHQHSPATPNNHHQRVLGQRDPVTGTSDRRPRQGPHLTRKPAPAPTPALAPRIHRARRAHRASQAHRRPLTAHLARRRRQLAAHAAACSLRVQHQPLPADRAHRAPTPLLGRAPPHRPDLARGKKRKAPPPPTLRGLCPAALAGGGEGGGGSERGLSGG